MQAVELDIAGVMLLTPTRHEDERGFLSEVYNQRDLEAAGIDVDFVQENHTFTAIAGTVRGLHYQAPPSPQAKLVRVIRGSIIDVAVDLRKSSPTYRQHVAVELSRQSWSQLLVPEGFAHGFCTLEDDTEICYRASAYWDPALDRGIAWDDPALAIEWGVDSAEATLSEKDRNQPTLKEIGSPFD